MILLYNYVTGHALFFISVGMLKGVFQFFKKNDQKKIELVKKLFKSFIMYIYDH